MNMPQAPQLPAAPGENRVYGSRRGGIVLGLMALVFLVPAGVAFVNKFIHFCQTVHTDEMGKSALVPMLNYLAVAAGFTCLFVWALLRGMFRDIEAPKYTMLENEAKLDEFSPGSEAR
jgi:hypothetical protein